jgi:arginyl-tRNA synthetase
MKNNIQDILVEAIKYALKLQHYDRLFKGDLFLDLPLNNRFGDLSSNIAFQIGSLVKKSPFQIAQEFIPLLKEYLKKKHLENYVQDIKVEGAGFINFYLSEEYFYAQLKEAISQGKYFGKKDYGKKKKVLIEFVSANPTGPLSVAHARQAAVGDALANILGFLGFKVKKEYYLNDEGRQIDILGESIALRLKELCGEKIAFPPNYYQGEYIYDIARKVKSQKAKVKNFSEYGVNYILKIIKKELKDFGIKFDYWYSQKALRESGKIEKALAFLKRKGFLYEQDGALWFKSSMLGDDKDRVVIKSDGTYTYLAPDIAYHQEKYQRGFVWLINLWGPDHHGYINRLKAAVKALGKEPDSLSIIIVQLASIFRKGIPIQMSTRKGQYITLREVLDEVGGDASRFFLLMRRTSSHLDFDLEMAKKQTPENPVYYIQYAHARICSILRNAKISTQKIQLKKIDLTLLKEKEEIELIKQVWQFSYVLDICLKTQDPYPLTVYLQELAESFHRFYDRHRVLGEDEQLMQTRILLIAATKIVLANSLKLMRISQPEKM